ncbi:hypothetical protein BHE74_00054460 [Ensete ventricosum]|nr:hypothetical protein BHE74_00054460 [Ensete ventricosum]
MELQPNNGPRLSLGIGPGLDDAVGFHWEFARRFAEGIRKLAENTSGDHREKIGRLAASMPEATRLAGESGYFGRLIRPGPTDKLPYPGFRAPKPPRSAGFDLYPKKIGSGHRCASRRRTREWT